MLFEVDRKKLIGIEKYAHFFLLKVISLLPITLN